MCFELEVCTCFSSHTKVYLPCCRKLCTRVRPRSSRMVGTQTSLALRLRFRKQVFFILFYFFYFIFWRKRQGREHHDVLYYNICKLIINSTYKDFRWATTTPRQPPTCGRLEVVRTPKGSHTASMYIRSRALSPLYLRS